MEHACERKTVPAWLGLVSLRVPRMAACVPEREPASEVPPVERSTEMMRLLLGELEHAAAAEEELAS